MTTTTRDAQRQDLITAIYAELGYASPALPTFLTENELAKVLRISPITLRTRRQAGRLGIAHTKVCKAVLYRAIDVADFILSHRQEPTP
ncbi:MAG: helix-turn-helix domain-containing protein [bacterium]|nr:helix-turn-helix domain-containing protein [bacterium]